MVELIASDWLCAICKFLAAKLARHAVYSGPAACSTARCAVLMLVWFASITHTKNDDDDDDGYGDQRRSGRTDGWLRFSDLIGSKWNKPHSF